VSDTFSVHNNEIQCNLYASQKKDINCINSLIQLAESQSLFFSNKSASQLHTDILKEFPNTVLHIIINSTTVALEQSPRTITLCESPDTPNQSQQPDELTSVIKTKFFQHLVQIDTKILEALSAKHLAMQRLFLLLLDSQIPGHGPAKPVKDLCEAARRLVPIYSSLTLATPMDEFQAFIDLYRNGTVATSSAFNEISTLLSKLCPQEANRPVILKILHGLQTMQTNMQNHFASFAKHKSSTKPQLPIPMPLLFTSSSTAADIQQAYYNVLRINLGIEDLKFLYTITENEKAYTIQWFEDLLRKTTAIPNVIPIQTATQNSPFQPKSYKQHPELRPSAKSSSQPTQQNTVLNDDPFSLIDQFPSQPTLPPQLFQQSDYETSNTAPPPARIKRNSITDFFADITGLAPYDEVQKLQRNEEQLKALEEETTKEVKIILSQTNAIVDSLKEQSQKLATLYKDESSVKSALSTILQDESTVMAQMS